MKWVRVRCAPAWPWVDLLGGRIGIGELDALVAVANLAGAEEFFEVRAARAAARAATGTPDQFLNLGDVVPAGEAAQRNEAELFAVATRGAHPRIISGSGGKLPSGVVAGIGGVRSRSARSPCSRQPVDKEAGATHQRVLVTAARWDPGPEPRATVNRVRVLRVGPRGHSPPDSRARRECRYTRHLTVIGSSAPARSERGGECYRNGEPAAGHSTGAWVSVRD